MTKPGEREQPQPGPAPRDVQVVTGLFAAYADALEAGEAKTVRRIGEELAAAAERPRPGSADEPETRG